MKKILRKIIAAFCTVVLFQTIAPTSIAITYQETVSSVVNLFIQEKNGDWYTGSGVIISVDGVILTAAHVIIDQTTNKPAEIVYICTIETELDTPECKYSGRVMAYSEDYDLALIKLAYGLDKDLKEIGDYIDSDKAQKLNLPYVDFSDTALGLGYPVTFLGFPTGFGTIVQTKGIISNLIPIYEGVVGEYVTDAIVNPGNSGGPAYNDEEKIVGIVTAGTVGYEGGNYGVIIGGNEILFWFLDLVEQKILEKSFVDQIFSNDNIQDLKQTEIFADVNLTTNNAAAIAYLKENLIINGYPDGTFKPENSLNRAELLKILLEGSGKNPDSETYKNCFPDVKTEWFARYVCYAKENSWISGYSDGKFKPEKAVSKAEAIKMLLEIFEINLTDPGENPYNDVETNQWFAKYIDTAKTLGILEELGGIYLPNSEIKRNQISENLYRLLIGVEKKNVLLASTESLCRVMQLVAANNNVEYKVLDEESKKIEKKYNINTEAEAKMLGEKYKNDTDLIIAVANTIEQCGGKEVLTRVLEINEEGKNSAEEI